MVNNNTSILDKYERLGGEKSRILLQWKAALAVAAFLRRLDPEYKSLTKGQITGIWFDECRRHGEDNTQK